MTLSDCIQVEKYAPTIRQERKLTTECIWSQLRNGIDINIEKLLSKIGKISDRLGEDVYNVLRITKRTRPVRFDIEEIEFMDDDLEFKLKRDSVAWNTYKEEALDDIRKLVKHLNNNESVFIIVERSSRPVMSPAMVEWKMGDGEFPHEEFEEIKN